MFSSWVTAIFNTNFGSVKNGYNKVKKAENFNYDF